MRALTTRTQLQESWAESPAKASCRGRAETRRPPEPTPDERILRGFDRAALPEDLRIGLKLKEGATYGEAIVLGQARAAIKVKTDAAREIADRFDGKARQPVEASGNITVGLAELIERTRKAEGE